MTLHQLVSSIDIRMYRQVLFTSSSYSGEYGRKFFTLINIIMTDFILCGIVQPILVSITFIASPIVALLIVICKRTNCNATVVDTDCDAMLSRCFSTPVYVWHVRQNHLSFDCQTFCSNSCTRRISCSTNSWTRLSCRIFLSGIIARSLGSIGISHRTKRIERLPFLC
jgi:hypothetical protein